MMSELKQPADVNLFNRNFSGRGCRNNSIFEPKPEPMKSWTKITENRSCIPEWQEAVRAIGDSLFIHTTYSFNHAVKTTTDYASKLAVEGGGNITDKEIRIKNRNPSAGFDGSLFP